MTENLWKCVECGMPYPAKGWLLCGCEAPMVKIRRIEKAKQRSWAISALLGGHTADVTLSRLGIETNWRDALQN